MSEAAWLEHELEVAYKNAAHYRADREKLADHVDLMVDEFKRIAACPGATAEIKALCLRGMTRSVQAVPVLQQRDEAVQYAEELQGAAQRAAIWLRNRMNWPVESVIRASRHTLEVALAKNPNNGESDAPPVGRNQQEIEPCEHAHRDVAEEGGGSDRGAPRDEFRAGRAECRARATSGEADRSEVDAQGRGQPRPETPPEIGASPGQRWVMGVDGRTLYDEGGEHDVRLDVDGDWESDEQRIAYSRALMERLNGEPHRQGGSRA